MERDLDEQDEEPEQGAAFSGYALPNCIPSPGLVHTVHNLLHDVDLAMPGAPGWMHKWKILAPIITKKHYLKRFVGTCVVGTPLEALRKDFEVQIKDMAVRKARTVPWLGNGQWSCHRIEGTPLVSLENSFSSKKVVKAKRSSAKQLGLMYTPCVRVVAVHLPFHRDQVPSYPVCLC